MPLISSSDDLRLLAEERIDEATTLLGAGHFSGAFYLAGYAVEVGLKAVLTSGLVGYAMPNQKEVSAAHSHVLPDLAKAGGLEPAKDSGLRIAWTLVSSGWGPEDRYRLHTEVRAREMVDAAREVLEWLKPQW